MIITRVSLTSGIERTLDLPITDAQWAAYEAGGLVQDTLVDCTPDQREFVLTGMTPEEWDYLTKEDEE